jgi:hypothetical protein
MAMKFDVIQADRWFKNTKYTFKYRVWQRDGTTPRDVAGYTLSWMLKVRDKDPDASALLNKTTTIQVTGVFNLDPALNTQLVEVPVADTDTVTQKAGMFTIELKRTDIGLETVLSKGLARLLESGHQS